MVSEIMYTTIRQMYFKEHLSISEISRRMCLARNTVKKWLRAKDGTKPEYRRDHPIVTKIKPFEQQLILALNADLQLPKQNRRTAIMLFEEIQKHGFTGGYSLVRAFVHQWYSQHKTESPLVY